ncbi:MAG: hypothetical protein Q8O40_16730, partial [Chloroflexota bacterium]|nr:hypothetical protein [Chloroflexota bacterium]
LREETLGLKELMRRRIEQVQKVELDTPEVLLDLNRPEDYQAAIGAVHQTSRPGLGGATAGPR